MSSKKWFNSVNMTFSHIYLTTFIYITAIIDCYSKAVLSYNISNTMDSDLVMSVLNEALLKYTKAKIFNTEEKEIVSL